MGDVSMVRFSVSRDAADVVCDWLWCNGASAVVEADEPDSLFPDVVSLTADLPAGLVDDLLGERVVAPALEAVLGARVVGDANDDLLAAQTWKEFATPVECGRFVVVPDWLNVEDRRDATLIELRMDPGDAFGAGTHVTTRLCLEAIGDVIAGGESVLDFGCGTGVLGVAAAMLGAATVRAVDIDPEAIRVTRSVAALNGVAERVTAALVGPHEPTDPDLAQTQAQAQPQTPAGPERTARPELFDVVFANVLITVITGSGGELTRSVTPGGVLVLSGILAEQRDRALVALGAPSRFDVEEEVERDGWLLLVLRRTGKQLGRTAV